MPVLDARRPFTRAQALAAGLTDAQLRGPRFQRVFPRVHLCATVRLTPELRVEATLLLHPPGAFASHVSAARLHRLPVPTSADEHVTVGHPDRRRRNPGVRCHVSRDADDVVAHVRDRVDSPMETRVRMLLVLGGLPEPETNVLVRDVDGTPLRRYDLSYPAVRVAVEYD